MPSQLWAETNCEMVERWTKGSGKLATENSEEQQHTEHQSSPSTRQRQVSPSVLLMRTDVNDVMIPFQLIVDVNSSECDDDSCSSPATHAAPVMATMMHKTV